MDVRVREARAELAPAVEGAARGQHLRHRAVDVLGPFQPEPEVREAARAPGRLRVLLERDHVVRTRALHLDAARVAVVLLHAEHRAVELERALRIADREVDVREAVGLDHDGRSPSAW